jgi:hypothetical protein
VFLGGAVLCAQPRVRPPALVRLRFTSDSVVPAAVRNGALVEAARVWNAYGVAIDAREGAGCDGEPDTVHVVFDLDPSPDESIDSLGVIRFTPQGVPLPHMNIHYGTVMRMVLDEPLNGLDPRQWPVDLHHQVAGRALGRALAHELGHYLLRWRHHADSGLMRASFRPAMLAAPELGNFALTPNDEARLQIVFTAFPPPDAATASVTSPTGCRLIAFHGPAVETR